MILAVSNTRVSHLKSFKEDVIPSVHSMLRILKLSLLITQHKHFLGISLCFNCKLNEPSVETLHSPVIIIIIIIIIIITITIMTITIMIITIIIMIIIIIIIIIMIMIGKHCLVPLERTSGIPPHYTIRHCAHILINKRENLTLP